MPRKTLIFGNGLGKMLDSNFFELDRAIGEVWSDNYALEDQHKLLIRQCLPQDLIQDHPQGEDDLDVLQRVLAACDYLNSIGSGGIHWLSEEGREFPEAIRRFILKVANKFHVDAPQLPDEFANALSEFLRQTKSHIGTLNYDNLLYQPLIEAGVLAGYDGSLVDGFHNTGFSGENLERRFEHDFGYYLHLHGSPLFVDRDGVIIKLTQAELRNDNDRLSSHIVLTHVVHKPSVITASNLLLTYWEYLIKAFEESTELILFGYSGVDEHLNEIINIAMPNRSIRVVEWSGSGDLDDRMVYWNDIFNDRVTLVHLDKLTDFRDW